MRLVQYTFPTRNDMRKGWQGAKDGYLAIPGWRMGAEVDLGHRLVISYHDKRITNRGRFSHFVHTAL